LGRRIAREPERPVTFPEALPSRVSPAKLPPKQCDSFYEETSLGKASLCQMPKKVGNQAQTAQQQ